VFDDPQYDVWKESDGKYDYKPSTDFYRYKNSEAVTRMILEQFKKDVGADW
jgi:hypothetical protein